VGLSHKPGVLSIHFGKTAAYAALSPDGRFSAWLQTVGGITTWRNKRGKMLSAPHKIR
jgi:hypothetical protein